MASARPALPATATARQIDRLLRGSLEVDAINPVSTCLIKNAHIMAGCALLQVGGRA